MSILKAFPDRVSYEHVMEEIRIQRLFVLRLNRDYLERIKSSGYGFIDQRDDVPTYVPQEHDVIFKENPTILLNSFYEEWYPHGLEEVLWVFRMFDDGVTEPYGVIARFDNEKGALLFFMQYG